MNNEKNFDEQIDNIMKETRELTADDMEGISGGAWSNPSGRHAHNYINSGETKKLGIKILKKYICKDCGYIAWK
ncbi:MAG: hypothetical protein K5894_02850 [Lachnospiraceae bacterium]|nr:hypothetical protein [Lachnospiraceae bacterium]